MKNSIFKTLNKDNAVEKNELFIILFMFPLHFQPRGTPVSFDMHYNSKLCFHFHYTFSERTIRTIYECFK